MKTMDNYIWAFRDGFISRADLVGNILGRAGIAPLSIGFVADKYSLRHYRSNAESTRVLTAHEPIKRDVGENALKIAGDLAGLTANIISLGLINTMLLAEIYCRERR